ncbi:MAG: hypothetical protein ACLVKO_08185 [Dysgonomonas sp.]
MIHPSAEASNMVSPANIDVNYYIGKPSISLPLYVLKDGDIEIPISLNYISGGVKGDDIASNVGLGWNLNVGGSVTRSIRGLPDDLGKRGFFSSDNSFGYHEYVKYISNVLGVAYFPAPGVPSPGGEKGDRYDRNRGFYNQYKQNYIDIEPDFYHFSFMGYSGKFVYGEDNAGHPVLYFQSESDIELINPSASSPVSEFRDINGYEYYFNKNNQIPQTPQNIANVENQEYVLKDYSTSSSPELFTYWTTKYLAKIVSPTKQEAIFSYAQVMNRNTSGSFGGFIVTENDQISYIGASVPIIGTHNCKDYPAAKGYVSAPWRFLKVISQIQTKNYLVVFERKDKEFRKDTPTNNRIDAIKVYYTGNGTNQLIKHLRFNYEYLYGYGNGGKDSSPGFMCLTSIEDISVKNQDETIDLFSFDYWDPYQSIVKSRGGCDFWGYITWNPTDNAFPLNNSGNIGIYDYIDKINAFDRYPRGYDAKDKENPPSGEEFYSRTGMLKKITYPTKAYTEFVWEPHRYSYIGNVKNPESGGGDPVHGKFATDQLIWKNMDNSISKLSTDLYNVSEVTVSAYGYYNPTMYDPEIVDDQAWFDYSGSILGGPANQFFSNCNTPFEYCEKQVMEDMPVVYFVKQGTDVSGITNIFADRRVEAYVIITNDLIKNGETVKKHFGKGNFTAYLKPGKIRSKANPWFYDFLKRGYMEPTVNITYFSITKDRGKNPYERTCGGQRISIITDFDGEKGTTKEFHYGEGVLMEAPRMQEKYYVTGYCSLQEFDPGYGGMSTLVHTTEFYRIFDVAQQSSSTQGSHICYPGVEVREDTYPKTWEYNKITNYYYTSLLDDGGRNLDEDDSLIECGSGYPIRGLFDSPGIIKYGNITSKDHFRGLLKKKVVYDCSVGKSTITEYEYKIAEKPFDVNNDYIPSGLYTLAWDFKSEVNEVPVPPLTLNKEINFLKDLSTRTSSYRLPISDLGAEPVGTGTNYFIGSYRLIPYKKYLLSETITEIRGGGKGAQKKQITYKYRSGKYNNGDPQYVNVMGATLPESVIVKDIDGNLTENSRTEYSYSTYFRSKIDKHTTWKYDKIQGKDVLTSCFLYGYNDKGLLINEKQAAINPLQFPTTESGLTFRTLREYEYLNGTNCLSLMKENGAFSIFYLWKNNLLRGEVLNYKGEITNETVCSQIRSSQNDLHVKCINYDSIFPDKISSIEEANGNITYYEYDDFGRLVYILDKSGNILKHYQYNYKR